MNSYHVKTYDNGTIEFYQDGALHRTDGPAIEWANGRKSWYQNGKYHRLDGPAIECEDGNNRWYIEDVQYSEEDFNKIISEIK